MLRVSPAVWLVGVGNLGVSLVWQLYNAYLPIYFQAGRPDFSQGAGVNGFGLNTTLTGLLMTLDNVAALLILPYVGAMSDRLRTRFGRRRPFIAIGLPIATIAFLLIPTMLSLSLPALMGMVAIFLVAMDIFRTPMLALMPDLTPPALRSQGNAVLIFLYNSGIVLAAVAGGQLFKISPAAPFYFGGATLLISCLITLACVREPNPEGNAASEDTPGLKQLIRNLLTEREPSLRLLLLAVFVFFLAVSALEVFFTSYAINRFGLDSGEATKLLAFFGGAGLAGALPAGWLGGKFGRKACLMGGLGILLVLLTLINFVGSLDLVKVLLVLLGLGWAVVTVNLIPLLLDMASPEQGGSYTGLFYLASQSAAIIGPVLAGFILDLAGRDYRILFVHIPFMTLITLLLVSRVQRGEAPER